MKDIKTKEVTTKPKTKNPASRIPKELMRTAILESKEKSQTIANARDNDMGEQSPSEYASGKVTSAEEWAARKTGRTVTRAGKTAAQTSYEKIKQRAAGGERNRQRNRGHTDRQSCQPGSSGSTDPGSTDPGSPAAKGGFRCRQNERAEDPGCQGDTKNPEQTGNSRNEAALHPRTEPEEGSKRYSKADRHPTETAGNHSD